MLNAVPLKPRDPRPFGLIGMCLNRALHALTYFAVFILWPNLVHGVATYASIISCFKFGFLQHSKFTLVTLSSHVHLISCHFTQFLLRKLAMQCAFQVIQKMMNRSECQFKL
jgi:hypothetical protein